MSPEDWAATRNVRPDTAPPAVSGLVRGISSARPGELSRNDPVALDFAERQAVVVGDQFRRVEVGFLLSAAILFALLLWVYEDPRARRVDVPSSGSSEELEARLAIIDESV
jgi:hypothetical protein